jgi:cold shock CspA family protein
MAQSYTSTRLQGRIESWNDERGFGFVVQNSTGRKAFVHISALSDRRQRPVVGALVTYEEGKDERGRPRAMNVRYVTRKMYREPRTGNSPRDYALSFAFLGVLTVGILFYRESQTHSAVETSTQEFISAEDGLQEHSRFQCEPNKTRCPQMSSCAEARFYLSHCPGVEMDGDHDGDPCEDQWCN